MQPSPTGRCSRPSQLCYQVAMGDNTKSLADIEADDIHCSPRTYPAGDAIIEGYEVGQARFPLGEPMLTAPDDLLLQLPGDGTQNTLLHGLSRHRGEADCLRFPGSSFLPFLQICILLPPSSSRTPPSPRGQLSIPGLSLFPPGSQEGGLGSENCTKEGTQHLHLLSTPPLVPQGCAVEEPAPCRAALHVPGLLRRSEHWHSALLELLIAPISSPHPAPICGCRTAPFISGEQKELQPGERAHLFPRLRMSSALHFGELWQETQ
ncbi:uncharacterized protein LOC101751112 isoform X2 [Gallus gallus]|uniref:uncharacterized protein LOC101751112 isoform X2 n=1 Tax=Gallus gallus TaxID=9031 RepID=UPI001AEBA3E9|nr:uncharacterized protein LOC101751112 isoform X2 [Gallus gallus]